jgi:hypothetical protein
MSLAFTGDSLADKEPSDTREDLSGVHNEAERSFTRTVNSTTLERQRLFSSRSFATLNA